MRALEVRKGWNGVERSWNELRDIYVEIFRPIGSLGVPPILAQGRPKRAQIAQKWPKSDFEGSGGPERFFALRVYQGEKEENDANFNYPENPMLHNRGKIKGR